MSRPEYTSMEGRFSHLLHENMMEKNSKKAKLALGSLEYDALNKNYRNENLFISGIKYILNWVVCSSLVSSQLTWGSFRLKIEITRKTKQKVAKESIGKEEQSYWILIFHDNGFWSPLIYFFFNRVKCEIIFFFFSKTNI